MGKPVVIANVAHQEDSFNWVVFLVPVQPPSLNKLLRMHMWDYKRLREAYGWELEAARAQLVDAGRVLPRARLDEPRGLRVVVYRARLLDRRDNFNGGLKPLIDAMKDMRIIADDRPSLLYDGGAEQFLNRDAPSTSMYNATMLYVGVLKDRVAYV